MKIIRCSLVAVFIMTLTFGCKDNKSKNKNTKPVNKSMLDNLRAGELLSQYAPYFGEDLARINNPRKGRTSITKEDIQKLKSLKNLTRINLSGLQINNWEFLKELPNLSIVHLDGDAKNNLGFLKELSNLSILHLYGRTNNKTLIQIKRLSNLKELYLSNANITNNGLEHIKSLVKLKRLNLEDTYVNDIGLTHLKPLINLNWLNLLHTGVTNTGIKKLQQSLPKCKILYSKK